MEKKKKEKEKKEKEKKEKKNTSIWLARYQGLSKYWFRFLCILCVL